MYFILYVQNRKYRIFSYGGIKPTPKKQPSRHLFFKYISCHHTPQKATHQNHLPPLTYYLNINFFFIYLTQKSTQLHNPSSLTRPTYSYATRTLIIFTLQNAA